VRISFALFRFYKRDLALKRVFQLTRLFFRLGADIICLRRTVTFVTNKHDRLLVQRRFKTIVDVEVNNDLPRITVPQKETPLTSFLVLFQS